MSAADFDARYRAAEDPWDYRHSEYEQAKYAATLAACGPGPFRCALELGASIGVFSALLAPRCEELVTIDFSTVATARARETLAPLGHVRVLTGEIPAALPVGRFDLIVASEVLYYLAPAALAVTLSALGERLVPGGRLVAVHWREPGSERPLSTAAVHEALAAQPWLERGGEGGSDGAEAYRLDRFERPGGGEVRPCERIPAGAPLTA
ncbi:MAG TPA: SAM-dependent methyltransferase [Solirubrobacteraceae bacterium]|nr:SAM-dependent methyltransferase [Solirubrobacteraceae bacterium]